MSEDVVTITACPICRGSNLAEIATRVDGVPVLLCVDCGMGVVGRHPRDLARLYGDTYYSGNREETWGYADYEESATHSLDWSSRLIELVATAGRVLDIGCANGHLLCRLEGDYERFGTEMSSHMASVAAERGITIVASTIEDHEALAPLFGTCDVVSAIAVLEHVGDLLGALTTIRRLLKDDGILVFEVPLIDEGSADSVWYAHSLEHIFYPTERGLRFVVQRAFAAPLVGSRVEIASFGSTYIGLVSPDLRTQERLQGIWSEAMRPVRALPREVVEFRFSLDILHAARRDRAALELLIAKGPYLDDGARRRIASLWAEDAAAAQESRARISEVEWARDWHAEQAERWRALAEARFESPLKIARRARRVLRRNPPP